MKHYLVTAAEYDSLGDVQEFTFVLAGIHPSAWLMRRSAMWRAVGEDVHAVLRFYRPISAETYELAAELLRAPPVLPT